MGKSIPQLMAAVRYNRSQSISETQWEIVQAAIGVEADGIPGRDTAHALAKWQREHGLDGDGKLGPATLAKLNALGIQVRPVEHEPTTTKRYMHSKVIATAHGFGYIGGMAIDCDGAPNAYHPDNIGIDFNGNAGYPPKPRDDGSMSKIWGLHLDARGKPVTYPTEHEFAGYFISTTALSKGGLPPWERYVDATAVPYVALPGNMVPRVRRGKERPGLIDTPMARKLRKGDLVLVSWMDTPDGGPDYVWSVYADVAPRWTPTKAKTHVMGEGSPWLAERLGHNPYAMRKGRKRAVRGIRNGVTYHVFPGTRERTAGLWPYTDQILADAGGALLDDLSLTENQVLGQMHDELQIRR